MSLKAKIEAVIYASEEPVTLAQLTGLLGHEGQAELDRVDSAQRTLALDAAHDRVSEDLSPSHAEYDAFGGSEAVSEPETGRPETEAVPDEERGNDAAATDAEADAKKVTRQASEDKEKTRRLRDYFRSLLDSLIADYASSGRGIEIREVAGGYRLSTKPEYHDAVRGFVKSLKPPLKLSLQALETLAVVAYKQPVTSPEISEIRGVDTGGVLGSLMARKLITPAGRKQVIGRPILYKTTKDFLLRFGLRDINELPSIEEFEQMAGELADAEPFQEEIQMSNIHPHHAPETAAELEPERHSHAAQADGSPDPLDDSLDDPLVDRPDERLESPDSSPLQDNFSDFTDAADSPDSPQDHEPDTVGTPEGDNEFAPDQPLRPAPDGMQRTPAIDTNKV